MSPAPSALPEPRGPQELLSPTTHDLERRVQERTAELAQANEALRNELVERQRVEVMQARLAAILETTADLVALADGSGQVLYLNRAGRHLVGLGEHEDVSQSTLRDYLPPWASDLLARDGVPTALREGVWSGETAVLSRTGREIPVAQTILARKDAHGNVEFFATVARDLTETRRAEEERQDLLKEYRMMFDSVPALIWYKDRANRILRANRPAAESMGMAVADLEGQSTYDLYPDEAANYHRNDLEVIDSARPKLGIVEQVVTGSGEKLWVQTDKVPYRDERGEIIGVIVFSVDVTERERAQEEVRKLNAELEQRVSERTAQLAAANSRLQAEITERKRAEAELAERARQLDETNKKLVEAERLKSEFFANVSHELRTPLTLILAPLESLLAGEHGSLTDHPRLILETLHNNSVRLLQMVTGLLDFAKLEARRFEVKRLPVEVVALTRAIVTDFAPMMDQLGLEYGLVLEPSPAWLELDRHLYERILFNLLSNALKFTPKGGRITVRLQIADPGLHLSVADTGIGIAEAALPNLFQKFQQLEGAVSRRFEGTGLGLALVKEFTDLLEGTVQVASKLGQGSTFTVVLPALRAAAPAEQLEQSRPRPNLLQKYGPIVHAPAVRDARENQPEAKLLIAEDNLELATYVVSLLRDLCQTRIARDGEEALDMVREWLPDVVLSDVMMPRRDGLSLCRELKGNPQTSAIPVVLLTALTHREALLKGWEAGADEYLFKPFHPRELVTRIRAILSAVQERRRADEALRATSAELARSNAELEQFAYIASHDLQEPLRKVQAFGDVLAEVCGPTLGEEGRDYLRRMQNAAQRMQQLINDLLTFSRVTSQARPFVEVDLTRTAHEVVSDLEGRLRDTRGRVEIGDLPPLAADPVQMRQLLQNLIGNALKFHRPNRPPTVKVQGRLLADGGGPAEPGPLWELTVQDDGIGFEEKYLPRIFAPFQRLHGRGEYEGTGIGLAICRKIVERHGGTITARSAPGQGATFIVRLPLRQGDQGHEQS